MNKMGEKRFRMKGEKKNGSCRNGERIEEGF